MFHTRYSDVSTRLATVPAPKRIEMQTLPINPLVTVIVPSFNQGRFIRQTLESVWRQNHRPLEVLVIDGGSTDETLDVLRSFSTLPNFNWVSEPDRGVVEAVNKGLAAARGEIVAIQSSDDCYLPGAIQRVVSEFVADSRIGLVYGNTVKVDEHGTELSRVAIGPYSLENLLLIKTWIPQPSAFFRKELADAIGRWDERIPYAPDTDYWIRMAFRTQVLKVDDFLSQRRIHREQRDVQSAKIARDYTRMIEQSQDIARGPAPLRRAAHAGKHLIRVRYNPYSSDWYAAWSLIRAACIYPPCLRLKDIVLFSCVQPLRRCASRLKRMLVNRALGPSATSESIRI